MHQRPTVIALLIALTIGAAAQSPAQSLNSSMKARIDSLFAQYDRKDSPGCALGVYRDGRIVYARGYGAADLEHDIPITTRTVFDIGSTSKQFTAACLVLLAHEGKLSLDDNIRKHIPEMPDYGHPITVRNLLNHTSGLRDYIGLMTLEGINIDDVSTVDDALRAIARQLGTDFEPGTEHSYSNTGYFLASIIIERVTDTSLRDFAYNRIFKPLGMTATTFIDDYTEIVPNRAVGYSLAEQGGYRRNVSNWQQNGDGGVFTTVEDLLRWDENFYHPRIGGAELPQALLQRGLLNSGDTLDYALGLFHGNLRGVETVHHGGAWGGYRAELIRVPSEHVSVAVLANMESINASSLARKALEIILADRLPEPPRREAPTTTVANKEVAIDPTVFDAYAGDYALEEAPDFVLSFRRDGSRFYSRAVGQGEFEIFPSSDSTFFLNVVNASVTFHREKNGSVPAMTLHQNGTHKANRVQPYTPAPGTLNRYIGRYYSRELNVAYTVTLEESSLRVDHPRYGKATLIPSAENVFNGDRWYAGAIEFRMGKDGRVEGLDISLGRLNKIRFDRTE